MSTITSTPEPGKPDSKPGSPGAPDGTKDKNETEPAPETVTLTKAQWDDFINGRNGAKAEARREREAREKLEAEREEIAARLKAHDDKIREYEEEKRQIEAETARKNGDVETLTKNYSAEKAELLKRLGETETAKTSEVAEWKTKYEQATAKYFENFVKRSAMEKLAALSTNPASSLLHIQQEYQFEAVEDADGNFVDVKVKGSDKTIEQIHAEVCKKHSLPFEKSERSPGPAAQPPTSGDGKKATALPPGFDKFTKDEKRKWYAEHPEYKP